MIQHLILDIDLFLTGIHGKADTWFDKPQALRQFKPQAGWTIDEILEHIALTSHFLLIIIEKGTDKAFRCVYLKNKGIHTHQSCLNH